MRFFLMLLVVLSLLTSPPIQAAFPIDLAIEDINQAPVDYALTTGAGQAAVVTSAGMQSQLHFFDGDDLTPSYRAQFKRLYGREREWTNTQLVQRPEDSMLVLNRVRNGLPYWATNDVSALDTSATGELRYRQDYAESIYYWSLIRMDNQYFRINASVIRNSVSNSNVTYNACAPAAQFSCSFYRTIAANEHSFWALRSRIAVTANQRYFELARFDAAGYLLEVQPLFSAGTGYINVRTLERDSAGVLHLAMEPDNTGSISAWRIDDREEFNITHSGRFDCRNCTIKPAGVAEWITVSALESIVIRKFLLGNYQSGAPMRPAGQRFEVSLDDYYYGLSIATSLAGQSLIRFEWRRGVLKQYLWLSANGQIVPTDTSWMSANFGMDETLFVTKQVQRSGQSRISGMWLNQRGEPVGPEELMGSAPVYPQSAWPMVGANNRIYAWLRFPSTASTHTEIWRISDDGNARRMLSFPRKDNLLVAGSAGSDVVYALEQPRPEQLRIRQIALSSGTETVSSLTGLLDCQARYAFAFDTTLIFEMGCAEHRLTYGLVQGQFRLLSTVEAADAQFINYHALAPNNQSEYLFSLLKWSERDQQYLVYGVSANRFELRLSLPATQNTPIILTADGGALLATEQNKVYTKYRPGLAPIANYTLCGLGWRQDQFGNFWSVRSANAAAAAAAATTGDLCFTNTLGQQTIRRDIGLVPLYWSGFASNGDLLQLRPYIQRFTPTSAGTIAMSEPQACPEDFLNINASIVRQQQATLVAEQELLGNPSISKQRLVLSSWAVPEAAPADDYLFVDGFVFHSE